MLNIYLQSLNNIASHQNPILRSNGRLLGLYIRYSVQFILYTNSLRNVEYEKL